MPDVLIRSFDHDRHSQGVRACLVELQDYERRLDPRMPAGADIADAYTALMFERCKQCGGRVFVAEIDSEVVGYATILPKVRSEDLVDGDLEYGLISDLVVIEEYRGHGLGRKLLQAAENYARSCRVAWLRIGVLAQNQLPHDLYVSAGFSPRYIELEKKLSKP